MASTLQHGTTLWRFVVAAVLAASVVSAAATPDVTVAFDTAHTTVDFTLGDVLHTVHGSFKLKSGSITFNPETGKANGSFIVDAKSGDSGSGARDRRMHKNILESDRYADIVFTPDQINGKVESAGASQLQVHGIFRIHGADHEITLPVQVQTDSGRVTAVTSFPVPYVKWGMKNPSNFLLKVNDTVDISIHGEGRVSALTH
jgi:polyisoprenoid-binding protein YceI